jgi:hypothetical protein
MRRMISVGIAHALRGILKAVFGEEDGTTSFRSFTLAESVLRYGQKVKVERHPWFDSLAMLAFPVYGSDSQLLVLNLNIHAMAFDTRLKTSKSPRSCF